jgi:Outer membrane protein and related peptidoglycan-associated (lipo)proteins
MNSRILLVAAALTGLAACSSGDRVVLVSDPDGHVGRIQVSSKGGSQILDQARTGSTVAEAAAAPTAPEAVEDKTIERVWGSALRAMPPRPQTFLLYFRTGSSELRDESQPEIPRIAEVLRDWAYPHVLVAGHADNTGSDETNIRVSRGRAEAVRDMLVKMGISPGAIEATSHGSRNPLVKTPDGVAEPRNRRVSVTIQ